MKIPPKTGSPFPIRLLLIPASIAYCLSSQTKNTPINHFSVDGICTVKFKVGSEENENTEKPQIAGSLSEASFRSARGMKSSDSALPADVAILADQLESFGRGLGTSFFGPSELSHEITVTSPTCFASFADESESFLIGPDLKKLRYPAIPGDMFHLSKGDTVPVDGLFVSGYSVLIDASSIIGDSKPIAVTPENPVLVAGTKVLDGQCTMMVARVGMIIQHESLMGYIQVLRNRLGQNTIDYKALARFVAACGTMVINSNSLFETVPLDEASVKHLQVTSSDFAGEGLGTWCLGYMELDKEFSAEDPIPTSGYTCILIVGSTVPPGIKECCNFPLSWYQWWSY